MFLLELDAVLKWLVYMWDNYRVTDVRRLDFSKEPANCEMNKDWIQPVFCNNICIRLAIGVL